MFSVALFVWWFLSDYNSTGMPDNEPMDMSVPAQVLDTNSGTLTRLDMMEKKGEPIDRSAERVTKKPFGILVTQATSPVQPEKFSGYHTGVDFEVFEDEINEFVNVKAICDGRVLAKEWVGGYGGVVVTSCLLDGEQVTVLYGHLNLESEGVNVWDQISAGDEVGTLGSAFSEQTDGERKHLHLGIHRGEMVVYAGYVDQESKLSDWIDPCRLVCGE